MRFLIFFILFCFANVPILLASDIDPVTLEKTIKGWYTDYKKTAPLPTKELRRPSTFVRHLHEMLLQQDNEEGVELYSKAILAVIGRGTGVGGLKTPRNDANKSYLLTPQERAIVKPALIDAERLRRSSLNFEQDYFGPQDTYFARAGRDDGRVDALKDHVKKVQNIALQVFSLKVSIDDPTKAKDQELYPHFLESLNHLDLSRSAGLPEIYNARRVHGTLSRFDILNMAFHDPSAIQEILEWDVLYRDIPLAYLTLQGLPNCDPAVKQRLIEEINSLRPGRLARQLLVETGQTERAILGILKNREIKGIKSTVVLTSFFNKYLPETGGALISSDDLLHLFKIVEREIDNDPHRTEVCLRALERFMRAYPTCSLMQIVSALISGIAYSSSDQNDFYLKALRTLYLEALNRYYATNKSKALESINLIFQLNFSPGLYPTLSAQCNDLKNEILADLLKMDCLDVMEIGAFANKPWITHANESELIEKFTIGIQGMQMNDLLVLIEDRNLALACKFLAQDKINELLADPVQMNSLQMSATHRLSTADWVNQTNKTELDKKLKTDIKRLTQPDLSSLMADPGISSDFKRLLANRFAGLGAWDELTHSLAPNGKDKTVFSGILQILKDHDQLDAPKIIFAAKVIAVPEVTNDLLEKAAEIAFSPEELAEFSYVIHTNHKIDREAAEGWIAGQTTQIGMSSAGGSRIDSNYNSNLTTRVWN